jgi:hypothetical protein
MNLEIKINEVGKGQLAQPIFFGNQSRVPSHTDVVFLSKTRVVIAHRFAAKLYLVQIKDKKYDILDTMTITYKGKNSHPDLIHAYKNTIYIVNLNNVLHIVDASLDKLRYIKSFVVHPTNGYHGLHAFEKEVFLVSTTKPDNTPHIMTRYHVDTQQCHHFPLTGNNNRMKDITFLNPNLFVVLTSFNDRKASKEKEVYDGEILLCSFENSECNVVDRVTFSQCHFDSIVSNGNTVYCTTTFVDTGSCILTADIVENKIVNIKKHPCAPFPHGIDIFENMIAYSSYGTSSTFIKELPLPQ